jgi:hypothetical protein
MVPEDQIQELLKQLKELVAKHDRASVKGGYEYDLQEVEILNISIKLKKLGHVLQGYRYPED